MAVLTNPASYAYDQKITEALMLVARENEYLPNDINSDTGVVARYRTLFEMAFKWLIFEIKDLLLERQQTILQSADLDEGWGYLPRDFIAFSGVNPGLDKELYTIIRYSSATGQPIIYYVGNQISYLGFPAHADHLHPLYNEALNWRFLYNCRLLDATWQSLFPILEKESAVTTQRLSIAVNIADTKAKERKLQYAVRSSSFYSDLTVSGGRYLGK